MYCSVLASGIAVMYRVTQRVVLTRAEGCRLAERALNEPGVLAQRTLPAGNQPGVGVDDERGIAAATYGWGVEGPSLVSRQVDTTPAVAGAKSGMLLSAGSVNRLICLSRSYLQHMTVV